MTIALRKHPTDRVLELGGGDRPFVQPACRGGRDVAVDVRMCHGPDGQPTVDFTADFNEPLPIQSDEFDGVLSHYSIEHVSYRRLPQLLREIHRVLKPGGRAVIVTANTEAQLRWVQEHPEGWDGKGAFESASCVLFGDQDYPDNAHKVYLSPAILTQLLQEAGFVDVTVVPHGERATDMAAEATKPLSIPQPDAAEVRRVIESQSGAGPSPNVFGTNVTPVAVVADGPHVGTVVAQAPAAAPAEASAPPAELFDKAYFNGGDKVGGYAREGYWDYPVHWLTFQHVMTRRPQSVLEVGCARGYILKRLQDAGVKAQGLEVSEHCWLTRACEGVLRKDICETPWPLGKKEFDLAFSVATFEHIPERHLPAVLDELARVTRRGLHGIDFGGRDDGFDKTHVTLRPREWWRALFDKHGLQEHEVVDKEELEAGDLAAALPKLDGKLKLNVGSFTTMAHHGWVNIDVHDLGAFAQQHGYQFTRHDVRQGLPYPTGAVDLIAACHFLEHLTYEEGLRFLRDCRRALKPDSGAMRIIVPDAGLLTGLYAHRNAEPDDARCAAGLDQFDEINDGSAAAPTPAGKLWALLFAGHQAMYDRETLCRQLTEAGFVPLPAAFREAAHERTQQIVRETIDMQPSLSLVVDAVPAVE